MTHDKGYVDPEYLQAAAQQLMQLKSRSYTLMNIQPGNHVLDVGCGPGTDTMALASLVGSTGRVVGLDFDPQMVAAANERAQTEGVGTRVIHEQGDATSLPFETAAFHSCRSERLFQHLLNASQALSEMARVTRPGGQVVVMDTDWGTASVDTSEVDTERRIFRVLAERVLNNGYSGRHLYRLFKDQGLLDVSIEIYSSYVTSYPMARTLALLDRTEHEALTAGVITEGELRRWHESLERADANGVFFGSVTVVMIAGSKP